MVDFVDREKARERFYSIIEEAPSFCSWVVLTGGNRMGKTEFTKEIVKNLPNVLDCCPSSMPCPLVTYAFAFIDSLCAQDEQLMLRLVKEYLKDCSEVKDRLLKLGDMKYLEDIDNDRLIPINRNLLTLDGQTQMYNYARFLGCKLTGQIKYIILDDFHLCSEESYNWIVDFVTKLAPAYVVAVCNFDLEWTSRDLKNIFKKISTSIEIGSFESDDAYFEVLRNEMHFENDIYLRQLSKQLYYLFDGRSQELFETIKLFGKSDGLSDLEKKAGILETATQLHSHKLEDVTNVHFFILYFLSLSPVPLSKRVLGELSGYDDSDILAEVIKFLFNKNLISQSIVEGIWEDALYTISDRYLRDLILETITGHNRLLCTTKLYRAAQSGRIELAESAMIEMALKLEEPEVITMVFQYLQTHNEMAYRESQANYIDRLFQIFRQNQDLSKFVSTYVAHLLYEYGYYPSALLVMEMLCSTKGSLSFDELMLLGDIQHILLSSDASSTYRKASEMSGISKSDYLKSLNRLIMALNQEHEEVQAAELYRNTFQKWEQARCKGLLELYRNSNNSFGYDEAMAYTIKGYSLALELEDELEQYKCLQNICMLKLQNGTYSEPLRHPQFQSEPCFEDVLAFFDSHPNYRHERAYPLLDLGAAKMFAYVESHNRKRLLEAKSYYSNAQLYAKSFYAQHIAETGLLIVNSHLYADEDPCYIEGLRAQTERCYMEQESSIADYRVHRKILLSLAVSTLISGEKEKARDYLRRAAPYISGYETLRYNGLCEKAECVELKKAPVELGQRNRIYYGSTEFVPWLISLCH